MSGVEVTWVCWDGVECEKEQWCREHGVCDRPMWTVNEPPPPRQREPARPRAVSKIVAAMLELGPGATIEQIAQKSGLSVSTIKRQAQFGRKRERMEQERRRRELLHGDPEDDDEGETKDGEPGEPQDT